MYSNKYVEQFELLKKEYDLSYIILNGNGKILISAPHCVEHTREGKVKYAEPETAEIALYLHDKYDLPCIIKLHNKNDDANWGLDSKYKQSIINLIKANNIQFFIDLHQMAAYREQLICLAVGNDNGNLLQFKKDINKIANCFDLFPSVAINNPILANAPRNNSKFVAVTTQVSSMLIEINSKIISDFYNVSYKDKMKVFKSFDNLINLVNQILKKEECN